MVKNKKVQKIRQKRQKGRYKVIGLFFIVLGCFFVIASSILFALFKFGIILKQPQYVAPIPQTSSQSVSYFDPTTEFKNQLKAADIKYSSLTFQNDTYTVVLTSGSIVYFSSSKNIEQQIASLQLIISNLTIEGKSFTSLDFRYDKPTMKLKSIR